MSAITTFAAWLQHRNEALRTLDMDWARRQLPGASDDEVRLLSMHKARYELKQLEPEYRHASGAWLRERGYRRFDGTELLPDGELPA
jgi:hypothetical protein